MLSSKNGGVDPERPEREQLPSAAGLRRPAAGHQQSLRQLQLAAGEVDSHQGPRHHQRELHLRQGAWASSAPRSTRSTSTTITACRPPTARTSSTSPTRTTWATRAEQGRRRLRQRLAGFRDHPDAERRQPHRPARPELRHGAEQRQDSRDHLQHQQHLAAGHAQHPAHPDPDLRPDDRTWGRTSTSTRVASRSRRRSGRTAPPRCRSIYGPAFFNADLGLFKNFTITEAKKLQIRVNGYNFLNHPLWSFNGSNLNLGFNGTTGMINTPLFGTVTTKQGHRIVQLAAKFTF